MLQEQHGVIVTDSRLDQSFGIAGRGRGHYLHAWSMNKVHFRVLRMERASVYATPGGSAQHHGSRRTPAVMRRSHHVYDLVEGAGDEVHELELSHRTQAGERRAVGRADDGRLGNGRVNHPLRAEVVDKAIGDLERAAVDADGFANAK